MMNKIKHNGSGSLIGILSLSLLLFSCGKGEETAETHAFSRFCLDAEFEKTLNSVLAKEEPIWESIPLTGKIESNPDQVVHFISLVSGVVTKTYFSLGEEVQRGQLLAEIISPDLNALDAERKSLEAEVQVSKRNLEAVKSMYQDKIASERDLLEAESQVKSNEAQLEKVRANLSLFQAVPEKGVFQVLATASGVVVSKNVTDGMHIVADDTPLFTIANLQKVWAMVNIYAGSLGQIANGMDAQVNTLSYPGEFFEGQISHLSQVFDQEEKVLKGRIVLANPDLRLKPGMVVDVEVSQKAEGEALAVPISSLIFDSDVYHVVIWKDTCELEVRKVTLLSKNKDLAYIEAGLNKGERVLTTNHLLVYEQLKNHPQS